jgi:hypothetical protein
LIKDNSTGYRNAPHFAGGVIFTTSTLDSLVSQAFYNPIIIRVLTKLVGGADYKEEGELGADNLKTESKSKSKKRGLNDIISSCLYQIPCPDLQTKTYAFLFNKLASVGMVRKTYFILFS